MTMPSAIRSSETRKFEVIISDPKMDVILDGTVILPENPIGFVVFAHGSRSSRKSPRNLSVARTLANSRIASVLFDLLTVEEAESRSNVFNIGLLTERLMAATRWLKLQSFSENKNIAFFGASTGGSAALMAGARLGDSIAAVVSRGGRPDLVPNSQLMKIKSPVLLLVGALDESVLSWNRKSQSLIPRSKLIVIEGASHLFEEEGALEKMANEAVAWFAHCFRDKELEKMINLQ